MPPSNYAFLYKSSTNVRRVSPSEYEPRRKASPQQRIRYLFRVTVKVLSVHFEGTISIKSESMSPHPHLCCCPPTTGWAVKWVHRNI